MFELMCLVLSVVERDREKQSCALEWSLVVTDDLTTYRLLDSNHCDRQYYFTRPLSPGQSDDTIIFDCRFVPLIQEELDAV